MPEHEPLIVSDAYDYADAFAVQLHEFDTRSAEQLIRCVLEQSPLIRWVVWNVHRHVLRFQLAPRTASDHALGWKIVHAEHDVAHIHAVSPIMRAAMVLRRIDPSKVRLATYVFFEKPVAQPIWTIATPIHRRLAGYLLERAGGKVASPA